SGSEPEWAGTGPYATPKTGFYASNCMAVNTSHSRLACANMQYGCLDLCDIEGNTLNRVNEIHLNRPGISVQSKRKRNAGMWYPVSYTQNNLFGFCDLTTSDDCIFALYSGRTYRQHKGDVDKGRIILVFDWNGTHLRTYHLSSTCSSISYDKATNTIYALSQEKGKAEIITLNL
ncbi:MAG: TolB-like 6-bladed beta-propeller domain-containing protein, partial [Odoribacter sp.]|nr:TolB-like 6-bladed beta-propeller domain-containing protein [Odoribacter sp.]